jgi:preprotein translocase SecE subunit
MKLPRRAPVESVRPTRPVRPARSSRTVSSTGITGFGKTVAAGIREFVYDTRSELRKVVWPTREQALNLTGLVIAASVAVGAFIGVVDLVVQKLFQLILGGA